MKNIKKIILLVYYILLGIALFKFDTLRDISLLSYWFLTAFMPFIPSIVSYILKIKIDDLLINLYNIFVMFAMIGGNIWGFYRYLGFDKFLHTISGIIIALIAFVVYAFLNNRICLKNKNELISTILFTEGVNALCAFLWECFEFFLLVFFDNDAIHHYDQGVYDTMGDMIVSFIGSLIIIAFILHHYFTKHNNPLIDTTANIINHHSPNNLK